MRRPNQKLTILAAAVFGACFNPSQAALITVNSQLDDGEGCTLRNAITSVNQGSMGGGFVGTCSSANADQLGTSDTIIFDAGLNNAAITLNGTELLIEKPVSVDASALSSLTVNANKLSRVLQVNVPTADTDVSLVNLTLTGGAGANSGGAISLVGNASLNIHDCTITGNTANFGGGVYGISNGSLTVLNTTITENHAPGGGGAGILASSGLSPAIIQDSVISDNTAGFDGGGITANTSLEISNTTISGNSATRSGGGISLRGRLLLVDSTLHSNFVTGVTGTSEFGGGAIGSIGSADNPYIYNSTISGNISTNSSGGIHTPNFTSFNFQNSTIKDNISAETFTTAATIGLFDSILSEVDGVVNCSNYNSIYAPSESIIEGNACGTNARTELTGMLPLANNGGPTLTHALEATSNAVDTGNIERCQNDEVDEPRRDQRGRLRDDFCDVGAYEFIDDSGFFVIPLQGKKAVVIPSDG